MPPDPSPDPLPDPPQLPARASEPALVVLVVSLLWLGASVGLGVAHLAGGRPLDLWFTTCTCGWLLGLVGFAVMGWQRAAARRGSRGAQRGLH